MTVTGILKVIDIPDDACLTNVRDLVRSLPRYLGVEFDEERITNVSVSNTEPDTTSRDVVWFRLDNSGNFIGIYVFVQGEWVQMFPAPQQIFRLYGRSDEVPLGYALITHGMAGLTTEEVNKIRTGWYPTAPVDPNGDPAYFTIFDVVYVGL